MNSSRESTGATTKKIGKRTVSSNSPQRLIGWRASTYVNPRVADLSYRGYPSTYHPQLAALSQINII